MRYFFFTLILFSLMLNGLRAADDTGAAAPEVETMNPGPFYGFWEFQEPAGDSSIVIIKRGGRVSRFWEGTASRAIEKGSWERRGEELIARWEAGHADVYRMLGDNAIERDNYAPGASLASEPYLTIRGVRVDPRLPGSLTIQREGDGPRLEEEATEAAPAPVIPPNSPYVGYWKIDQSTGIFGMGRGKPHYYLRLTRSGNATVALRDWEGDKGARGDWRVEGDRVVITWPNNRRDVLKPNNGIGYSLATYRPKDDIERDKPRSRAQASKVPSTEAERYFEAGNFKRMTVLDIRGTWIPMESTGRREYISIEGWGNAYRYPARDGGGGTDPGKWRLQSESVIITWVDGSKDVIRIAVPHFIQDSYARDEPITGTPERSIPVIRANDSQ